MSQEGGKAANPTGGSDECSRFGKRTVAWLPIPRVSPGWGRGRAWGHHPSRVTPAARRGCVEWEGRGAWLGPSPLRQQPPTTWGDAGVGALGTVAGSTRTSPALQWGHEDGDVPSAVPSAGGSGFQLVPLCHRLPGPRDHVLPVLHLARAALPGQVDLQGTEVVNALRWSIHPPTHPSNPLGTTVALRFPREPPVDSTRCASGATAVALICHL